MALKPHTNELALYRRHVVHCTRYPNLKNKPRTFRPTNRTEAEADTCNCPIWTYGYLDKERDTSGKQKPAVSSTGHTIWEAAHAVKLIWEAAKCLPAATPVNVVTMDKSAITVKYAVKEWLAARGDKAGGNPLDPKTLEGYRKTVVLRLLPWCEENGIVLVKTFEDYHPCEQFVRSWRQLKGQKKGELLGTVTKKSELRRFGTFLFYCLDAGWITKHGAKKIKIVNHAATRRYGLELDEYERLLATPPNTGTAMDADKIAAVKLMRHCGLRLEDAVAFDSSKIVPNSTGTGWNAHFMPIKTLKYGTVVTVPMPTEVKEALDALPGRTVNGVKSYFRISYSFLKASIIKWGRAAQKDNPFAHKFSAHNLRHTFAIQNLNHGVQIKTVSRWLGHTTVTTTEKYYSSPLASTERQAELDYAAAAAAMAAKATEAPALKQNVLVMKAVA